MNPPSALHSAMSRDRKPFTYTPGGLDLSEIKSERMAQRLMRNAMNQGVPEVPVQPVHTPSNPSAPVALPNYNCMPVQVFPTFSLPANPKSLLRTRSIPDPKDAPMQRVAPPFVNNARVDNNDTFNNKYTPTYSHVNNNRPMSMYEYNQPPTNTYSIPRTNYGSDGYTAPVLPEISYEAEYFRAPPRVYSGTEQLPKSEVREEKDKLPIKESFDTNIDFPIKPFIGVTIPTFASTPEQAPKLEINEEKDKAPLNESFGTNIDFPINKPLAEVTIPTYDSIPEQVPNLERTEKDAPAKENFDTNIDLQIMPLSESTIPPFTSIPEQVPKMEIKEENENETIKETIDSSIDFTIKPLASPSPIARSPVEMTATEENASIDNEQREVKVVKKQVKKENKVEESNGNQNGDANIEAETTVKLPTKKLGAKTETKVEVVKKILPDGTVEEVKTTTTKTTIDGRTEIKTKTETKIIPKEEESEEEVVEEEEEQEEVQEEQEEVEEPEATTFTLVAPKENGQESNVVKTEERSESTITSSKKVVVVQDSPKEEQSVEVEEGEEEVEEEEVEEEEVEDAEPVTVVLNKQVTSESAPAPVAESKPVVEEGEEVEVDEEETKEVKAEPKQEVVVEKEEVVEVRKEEAQAPLNKDDEEEEEEEEEEYEEAEEIQEAKVEVKKQTEVEESKEDIKVETVEKEVQQEKEAAPEEQAPEPKETPKEPEEKIIKVEILPPEEPKEAKPEPASQAEFNIPIREPSIPLEKVEDVEIKPIGSSPIITKTHTENTEIITSKIEPTGGLSTQTEYNKIENIVTVNRTTKVLDQNYENLTQQGIPTVKTYFPPHSIDRISTSPLPSRPYQPVYPPEPTTERRHSLLLERLSMERQMPSDIYQNQNNQSYDQTQYPGEPRSEVLTVSNVKPSTITDQQWYQQKNVMYNNVTSIPAPASQPWAQPKSQPQSQQQYQPQAHYQAQHLPQQHYQPQQQPQYQKSPTPQPQYQPSSTPQPQYQPSSTPQPQYQPSYSERTPERAPSRYSTYTPTPTWVSNTETLQNLTPSNQYSYLNKESSDSYQKSTQQQYSSSYVPPPWEQDSSYTSVNNTSQVYYQPAEQTPSESFSSSAPAPGWKPPPAKFTKNAPIAYIPPAPNQSFVRSASVSEPPRTPGRKTYYSEYERRYITVPESTYIPTETKYQPQPDPSPQYYYDNNEPAEQVEPQWRRELREFTEKTSTQTTTTEQTSVQPPWENQSQADAKYPKTPSATYTPTPTWSQTLRPRSWRERSFESEYMSQEWPKTNTLGRGRPLSTLGKTVEAVPERTRGVSVDRYNPSSYQSPAEHPPVQSHTLTTPVAGYHNPNVPAYHNRASAEPREQPTSYQPRVYREARASPLQSRSFKYLQWITGTEN